MNPCVCQQPAAEPLTPDISRPADLPPCEDVVMPFGKHKSKQLGQILVDDASYLDWLNSGEVKLFGVLLKAVAEMNVKYEAEISSAVEKRNNKFSRRDEDDL
jgi:hypothetical protein